MTTLADRVKAKTKAKKASAKTIVEAPKKKKKKLVQSDPAPVKKKSAKVKSFDTSGDDGPPWTVDDLSKEAASLGVRSYGGSEVEDTFNEEQHAKYEKSLRRLSKKVTDKSRPYNSPATTELASRLLLASLLRQLPGAEKHYAMTHAERAAYAYNALANQVRELMSDLRSMSSTDDLADQVIREAVNPAFLQLINFVIEEHATMRTKLNGSNNVESVRRSVNEQLNRILSELGTYGQEALEKAKEATRKSLKG